MNGYLLDVLREAETFVKRNTRCRAEFSELVRKDVRDYPPAAVREAIVNAILHTDYSLQGSPLYLAIYEDRLEVTNPGGLPYGLTLENELQGASKIRNRVFARIIEKLGFVELWGSGMKRIQTVCAKQGLASPVLEELGMYFRVSITHKIAAKVLLNAWQDLLVKYLQKGEFVSVGEAAKLWHVTPRTAPSTLKIMTDLGTISRVATSRNDPYAKYKLAL